MTTVDSWPKTLPMPSAQSWNSTTETHLTCTHCLLHHSVLTPLSILSCKSYECEGNGWMVSKCNIYSNTSTQNIADEDSP